jgi:hypothetical protein
MTDAWWDQLMRLIENMTPEEWEKFYDDAKEREDYGCYDE